MDVVEVDVGEEVVVEVVFGRVDQVREVVLLEVGVKADGGVMLEVGVVLLEEAAEKVGEVMLEEGVEVDVVVEEVMLEEGVDVGWGK